MHHAYTGLYPGKISLNACLERCGDLLLRQGKGFVIEALGWATIGKPTAVAVIDILGY